MGVVVDNVYVQAKWTSAGLRRARDNSRGRVQRKPAWQSRAELRLRVDSLLEAMRSDTAFGDAMSRGVAQVLEAPVPGIGARLGSYELTGLLGRGGMGVVYRAARADDQFQKDVAIKVAAGGVLTPGLRERFLRERQILATLDHPNIARLLDGGTTADGLPFVVMEFVEGIPIDDYCTRHELARRARIQLMIQVARGVDYAHRHLVVHRDLKPDNIFVTGTGEAKLLDFGIAKALGPERTGSGGDLTVDAQRLLTPDYASPEQLLGGAITTATDVYQLGVLLFELLTGSRPFHTTGATMGQVERAICETTPPRPHLDPDLDRILLQALEKDPVRRYVSAGALADDLERYLDGFPVLARTPSWPYTTAKFLRRHTLAASVAALLLVTLVAVAVAMTVLARRASRQARIANQTTAFLLGLFEANDPSRGRGDKITARELLDKGAAQLDRTGDQDPVVKVSLLDSMGTIYNALGSSDKAGLMLEQALQLRRDRLPGEEAGMADTLARLADVETDLSHYDKAIALSQQAVAAYRSVFGDQDERIALRWAQISTDYWELDNPRLSETYERQAIELSSRRVGRHDPRTLLMIGDFGTILDLEGKMLEAQPYYREQLAGARALVPANLPAVGDGLLWLGLNHYRLGQFAQAEQEIRSALALRLQAYAPGHPVTAKTQANLALVLLTRDQVNEALDLSTRAFRVNEALYGPVHRETAYAEDSLGLALLASGRTEQARKVFESDLKARVAVFPPRHIQIARTWMFLAMADLARSDLALAAEECRNGLQILDAVHGPHAHPLQAELDAVLVQILVARHSFKDAEEYGAASLASFTRSLPPGNPHIAGIESALGLALMKDRKPAQAESMLRQALAIDRKTWGPANSQTAQTGMRLAACLLAFGRAAEADTLVREYRPVLLASHNGLFRAERGWPAQTISSGSASASPTF